MTPLAASLVWETRSRPLGDPLRDAVQAPAPGMSGGDSGLARGIGVLVMYAMKNCYVRPEIATTLHSISSLTGLQRHGLIQIVADEANSDPKNPSIAQYEEIWFTDGSVSRNFFSGTGALGFVQGGVVSSSSQHAISALSVY